MEKKKQNNYSRIVLWAPFVLMVIAPLYVIRWKYFGALPTTLLEATIWLFLGGWIVWKIRKRQSVIGRLPLLSGIVLLLISSIVSVLVAADTWAGLGIFRAYILEPIVVYYALFDMYNGVSQKEQQRLLQSVWLGINASALWVAILGIVQKVFGIFIVTEHQLGRAHAVFNNGNALALYLGPIIAILIAKIILKPKAALGTARLFEYFVLLCTVTAFVMTDSTGGYVALLGTVTLIVIGRFVSFSKLALMVSVMVFFGSIILMPIANQYAPTQENPWQREGGTAQVRLCVWQGTYQLLKEHWLLGVGLSGFKEAYASKYITCDAEPLEYPHNLVMTVWSELGVVGIVAFVVLLVQSMKKAPQTSIYTAGLLYTVLHGVVDVPYFKNDLALLFWVILWLITVEIDGVALHEEN